MRQDAVWANPGKISSPYLGPSQMLLCAGVTQKRFLKFKVRFRRFRKKTESLSFYSLIYFLVHWRELTSDLFSQAHR